jgi:GMP synthase (glutamine-hydrolysing)
VPEAIVVQHVPQETPGAIGAALERAGVTPRLVRPFAGDRVPADPGGAAGLVVMGGPMGVYEEERYPFLRDERRLIEAALRREVPLLGVCLGSQLLAAVLGAAVAPSGHKEIGWHAVRLREAAAQDALWRGIASPFVAYHWHGDVFDLPHGAVSLAFSERTEHQAFRFGARAWGLLFHTEVTPTIVRDMVDAFGDELAAAGIERAAMLEGAERHQGGVERLGRTVFGRWANAVRRLNA